MAGSGNIDKLRTLIQKAADQVMTACDTLDAAMVEANGIGGKLAQLIPPHVQAQIDKLTAIVESEDQSALLKLDDLILSMPYRDIAPSSPSERREKRGTQINTEPNTGGGPQSAVRESILDMYRKEPEYRGAGLDFESLRESALGHGDFGELDPNSITGDPIDRFEYRQKIREQVENDDFEDLGEHIQESMDGKGHFDWKSMRSVSGSLNNLDFTSLRSTGRDGTDLSQITVR